MDTQITPTYNLEIKNFQSIKQQSLQLSGFSVICGKSDMGKSALRRSIQTALFNNWSKSFIRTGEKSALVTLSRQDNKPFSISALKSSTENQFTINDKVLPKMGKDIPEIPNHNFRQDLNIATQLEPLYMVSYKDTENTKILNNLFGIDLLEQAQYLCQLDLRRTKQDHKYKTEQLNIKEQEHKNTKEQYHTLNTILTSYKETQEAIKCVTEYITNLKQFNELELKQHSTDEHLQSIKHQTQQLEATLQLHNYLTITSTLKQVKQKHYTLNQLLDKTHNLITNQQTLLEYITAAGKLEKLKQHPVLKISFKSVQGITKLMEYISLRTSNHTESMQGRLDEIAEQLSNIDLEIAKHKCPTCGSTITPEHIKH